MYGYERIGRERLLPKREHFLQKPVNWDPTAGRTSGLDGFKTESDKVFQSWRVEFATGRNFLPQFEMSPVGFHGSWCKGTGFFLRCLGLFWRRNIEKDSSGSWGFATSLVFEVDGV
ncbi:hypothetical protein RUM44_012929 [Polyplax serrata]|uniref:Uncharacterized protein n=1 Tax=Polyplax serrata TaxID=468196 RepID=A0ABR1BCQ0_POLSC